VQGVAEVTVALSARLFKSLSAPSLRALTVSALVLFVLVQCAAASTKTWRLALPGYKYQFPADHAAHKAFKTEWWYYTGHLQSKDGRKFGYELTFFRFGVDLKEAPKSAWTLSEVHSAHFAVTDEQNKRFWFDEKMNRPALNIASVDEKQLNVVNGDWSTKLEGTSHHLQAVAPAYSVDLKLVAKKPPAIHGRNGVSQKADCKGCASHYYSLTRLDTTGTLTVGKEQISVTGVTWMDHEFGSNQMTAEQIGWDWYSVHLDNNTDLMFYVMRRKDGTFDKNSSGTVIDPDGSTRHLALSDYKITAISKWQSPTSKGTYPMGWKVDVPAIDCSFTIDPVMPEQELVTSRSTEVTYWEGSCRVSGKQRGKLISGAAYVEMTGYAGDFNKRI
jgi:predicted secreted hydrolase